MLQNGGKGNWYFAEGAVGTFLFLSPTAHFSQQLEKWAKEPEETKGFFTSLRAMSIANLTLHATRSRKSFCLVPSKDCLSNSAAAADANDERPFRVYRRASHSRNHIKNGESFSTGMFRAPARPTFALGGKSRQKRHSNLRFENPLTLYLSDFDTMYRAFAVHSRCRAV